MKMIDRFENDEIVVKRNSQVMKWFKENGWKENVMLGSFIAVSNHKEKHITGIMPGFTQELVTSEEFLRKVKEEMEFTKDMLETGMVVEYRNGKKYLVVGDKTIGNHGYMEKEFIGENMKDIATYDGWDVISVYEPDWRNGFETGLKNGKLIWKRNDQKDEALKELEEAKAELKKAQEKIEAAENKIKGCE